MPRHAWVDVDLGAIRHNVSLLADLSRPAQLCAVVKAEGYGHGAVPVALEALAAGAARLGVALVEEGMALREAGIDAPILVLSEPPPDVMVEAHEARLTPTLYSPDGVAAAAAAAAGRGEHPWPVQLKIDTGMHRVGVQPDDAVALATSIVEQPSLALEATFTHLAVADEPDRPETTEQVDRYLRVIDDMSAKGIDPGLRHAANSAGLIAHTAAHLDMVRAGIAIYGIDPGPKVSGMVDLRPAMSVRTEVTLVKPVPAGDGVSYGLRHTFDHDAVVATIPLGYADGVSRRLGLVGGAVLIGGVRRPIRGVVTMDQFVVEVTDGPAVGVGDEVIILGRQGDEEITANEMGQWVDTIGYEVVCGFGPRIPRVYRNGSIP